MYILGFFIVNIFGVEQITLFFLIDLPMILYINYIDIVIIQGWEMSDFLGLSIFRLPW